MENNDIIQRLLQEDSHSDKKSENKITNNQSYNSEGIPMSKIRVVTAKYKVLIIILAIILCVIWIVELPKIKGSYNSKKDNLNNLEMQLSNINIQIK